MSLQNVVDFAQSVKNNFETSKYWEFEKVLGSGAYGLAVLLQDKVQAVECRRRIVMKLSLAKGERALENEIHWLKELHGAQHIGKILASCNDLAVSANALEQRSTLTDFVSPMTAFETLAGMKGPALAMEYIEHGDLAHFKQELNRLGERPPNRVLWSLFLCLTRACIGMAYPVGRELGTPSVLEALPIDDRPPRGITHGDIMPRNIMLGNSDDTHEHYAGPTVKLIDFGSAADRQTPHGAMRENLSAVARVIVNLIHTEPVPIQLAQWRSNDTYAGVILPKGNGPIPYPRLDPELRDLLARCLYVASAQRPSLEEALEIASHAVLTKTAASFPEPSEETDAAISAFWQRLIFNVPLEEPAAFDGSPMRTSEG